jgi:hypothetical protein
VIECSPARVRGIAVDTSHFGPDAASGLLEAIERLVVLALAWIFGRRGSGTREQRREGMRPLPGDFRGRL